MTGRYLLEASDNPFIQPADAHHDISFACIAYLRTSFELIDPYPSEELRMIKVGKGFHALQLYAHEHWITHLLTYLKMNGGFERRPSQPLMEQLNSFCEAHKQTEGQLSKAPNARIELHRIGDAEQYLHYISNADARDMVQETLRLRKLLKNEPHKTGKGMSLDSISVGVNIRLPLNHPISSTACFIITMLTYCQIWKPMK
jgi:hypothetical protein